MIEGSLIIGTTTLIDRSDENYMYIGSCKISGSTAPSEDSEIWTITKITFQDGQAIKIEHGINNNNTTYLSWANRLTYNYI